jgi:ATP-dependent Clp protease ATP-binding subunit ClpC
MFEHYTDKARRSIFFARFEASQFGSPYIETEHLLLGLLREDRSLANRFLHGTSSIEGIRREIENRAPRGEKLTTSVDLPLSAECKHVLACAAEEAERLSHKHIGTEHMFAALLREEGSLAAQILHEFGTSLEKVREKLAQAPQAPQAKIEPPVVSPRKPMPLPPEFSRDLTREALDGRVDPLVGRESEMERMIEILSRRSKNNPVLVGEPGVGKSAMVRALAQRIVQNDVPAQLVGQRVMMVYLSLFMAGSMPSEERAATVISALTAARDVILFVEELFAPAGREGVLDAASLLRPPLSRGEVRCIASATPEDYAAVIEEEPWLARYFHAINVPAPDEADAIKILFGIRDRYEKFHGVTYADDALEYAVRHSARYLPARCLPDKAIDVIDEAAARVKLRPPVRAGEAAHRTVTRKDIEEVVARWAGIPLSSIGQAT